MKWQYENSVSPYPLPSTQEKIFPNVHGLLTFKDEISWTNIFLASCHVQLYLDYLTGYASFYFFVCGWNAHRAGVSERRPQTPTLGDGRGARDVDTRGGTKCIPPTSCLLMPVLHPTRWATLVLVLALVFLWLRINFWCQFQAEFCPNRARKRTHQFLPFYNCKW